MNSHDRSDDQLSESEYADILGKIVHSYNNHLAAAMGFNELSLLISTENGLSNNNYSENAFKSCELGVDFGQSLLASIGRLQLSLQEHDLQLLFNEIEGQLSKKLKANTQFNIQETKNKPELKLILKVDKEWFVKSTLELIQITQQVSGDCIEIDAKLIESVQGASLRISVLSGSANFSEEQQKNIFTPFYFIENSSMVRGIGLAKVKGFFQQINARITLSENGFDIVIPCC